MSIFNNMLQGDESLFLDSMPLDPDYQPSIVKYRENEQAHIATCIKPLFSKRSGKNLVITGSPGIGKTVAIKHVLYELGQENGHIKRLYINCWKKDTPYKIALELCNQLGFKFVANRDTSELFTEVARILNKTQCVIVFDEADKIMDQQVFYTLLEDIYTKTMIFITNEKDWLSTLDKRIHSRLMAELLEFKSYNYDETKGILQQRIEHALVPNVFPTTILDRLTEKTFDVADIRVGLFLIKNTVEAAENKSSRIITEEHAEQALNKLDEFHRKSTGKLNEEEQFILNVVKSHSGKSTKEIYQAYQKQNGKQAYTTFQRKMRALEKSKFITIEDVNLGRGRTTKVSYGSISEDLGNYISS